MLICCALLKNQNKVKVIKWARLTCWPIDFYLMSPLYITYFWTKRRENQTFSDTFPWLGKFSADDKFFYFSLVFLLGALIICSARSHLRSVWPDWAMFETSWNFLGHLRSVTSWINLMWLLFGQVFGKFWLLLFLHLVTLISRHWPEISSNWAHVGKANQM